jgi:hypothetical protein
MLQASFALRAGRDVVAAGWALIIVVAAANIRRGLVPKDGLVWRAVWIVLAVLVLGTLALVFAGSLWARAV